MKIIFHNLEYGRGHTGAWFDYVVTAYRFLYTTKRRQKTVLNEVVKMIDAERPDVFAGAEVLTGALRNGRLNQHEYLCSATKHPPSAASVASKYGVDSILNTTVFHAGNSNNALVFTESVVTPLYFTASRKKLVMKITLPTVTIFTVHLPLVAEDRHAQLRELAVWVNECDGDVVVCGDFNIFGGFGELQEFFDMTTMQLAGEAAATYPAYKPREVFDVCLYRFAESGVVPTVRVVPSAASDHLPIVIEW